MIELHATTPLAPPPAWAVLQRKLFELLDQSVTVFLEKYTRPDGELIWREEWGGGSPDDFFEPFYNWPLLYLLGGGDHLLELGRRQWEAVTRMLTRLGVVHKEYTRHDDSFHQSESDQFFYFLCMADPSRPEHQRRARRFAGFYLNEDPEAINIDPARRLLLSPYTGSGGAKMDLWGQGMSYAWSPGMAIYGLPFHDLPGIQRIEDLKDPALARRMGEAMHARMRQGDVASNLGVASLVTHAYLMAGEGKYRQWVLDYVEVWAERARQNGGLLPDNVGLSGQVGETLDGKWYGGYYGWTFPHGFYNLQMAATNAAANAFLLTGDSRYLELPRLQMDRLLELGEERDLRDLPMSLAHHWTGILRALGERTRTFVIPYRFGDVGWFDYQPMSPIYPLALWNLSMTRADWERIETIRRLSRYDWNRVFSFHTKEDSGHEQPWMRFLAGENPGYPEAILQASLESAYRRLALIHADQEPETHHDVHHWQQANPVTTEALIQLTLGGPQVIYNGGLLHCRLRYFDAQRNRPGLPPDVAALVEALEPERCLVRLANLSPAATRSLIVQAGAFGEHRFSEAAYTARTSPYPGAFQDYAAPDPTAEWRRESIHSARLKITLPPATQISIDLGTERFVHRPSFFER